MLGNLEDIQKISKDNIDAMTKSFGIMPKTVQAIATEMADYSKRSFENGAKAVQNLLAVKSLDKAIEVQSECQDGVRRLHRPGDKARPTLLRTGQTNVQALRGLRAK